jgi:hypothetical protein
MKDDVSRFFLLSPGVRAALLWLGFKNTGAM